MLAVLEIGYQNMSLYCMCIETSVQGQAKRDVVASDDYITMESGSGLEVWRGNTTEPGADESEIPCLINGDGEVPGECPTKDVPNNQNHSDTGDILSPEDPKTPGEENPQDYEPETTPNNPYYSVVFNVATPSKTTSESSAYYSVIQETETESSEVGPESSEVGPESSEVGPYYSVIQETETHEVEELVYHYAQVSLDNDAKKKKKRRPTSQERCLGKNLAAQTPDTLASSHANAVTATGYINMDSCGPLATEIACVNVESNPMATEHSIYKDAEQAYMNVEQSTVKATDHDPSDQDTEIADYVNVDPADFANVDTLTVMEQETVPADSGEKMSADSGETVLGDSGETVLGDSGETGPGDSGETELADYVNVDPGNITEREHAHQQD